MRHRILRTNGGRIAWTNTSRIPNDRLEDALRFVSTEVDLDRTIVHFKKIGVRRRTWGRAYPYVPEIANVDGLDRNDWDWLITVTDHFTSILDTSVVNTLAREAKHVEQYREKLPRSEVACRAFGAWLARRWLEAESAL